MDKVFDADTKYEYQPVGYNVKEFDVDNNCVKFAKLL